MQSEGFFQSACIQQVPVVENIPRDSIGYNLAASQDYRPGTKVKNHIHIMGGYDFRVIELRKQVYQLPPGFRIKIGRGFIHDQDAWGHREDGGD